MKLWRDNKKTGGWELPNEEVAERFLASNYADLDQYPWPLERAFPVFVGAPEVRGGLSSTPDLDTEEGKAEIRAVLRLIQKARNAAWAAERAAGERAK